MVVTRRISANPTEDGSPNVQPQPSPAPAPMSREMRRLFIDANPSLGGQASLELNQSRKRKSVAFVDLEEDDTAGQERGSHNEGQGAQEKDEYWFLPEGAGSIETSTMSSSPPSEHSAQRSDGTMAFAAREERKGAFDAPITISSQFPVGLTSPDSEKTGAVGTSGETRKAHAVDPTSRPTKVSRELKRLRIDANPSLSFIDLASPEPTSSSRFKAKRPVHDSREVPDSQETRTDRLLNNISRRLGDTTSFDNILSERATESRAPSKPWRDRPVSSSSKSAPKPPRRPRKNPNPQFRPVRVFPDPCPQELADQILRIFGEAAGDAPLLRALEGTAQDSIAREVRHEAPALYVSRAAREILCLETWDPQNGLTWDEHALAIMTGKVPPSKAELIRAGESRMRAERAERRSSMKDPIVIADENTIVEQGNPSDAALDEETAEEKAWRQSIEQLSPARRDYLKWYMSLPVMTTQQQMQFHEQNAEAKRIAEEQRKLELQMAGDPEWEREQEEKRRRKQEEDLAFEVVWEDARQEQLQRYEALQQEEQRQKEQRQKEQEQEEQRREEVSQDNLLHEELLQQELQQEDRQRDKGKGRAI